MTREDVDGDGDLTLKSPSPPASSPYFPAVNSSNDADTLRERSSSPALKRPASELDEQKTEPDASNEVGSPLRIVSVPTTTPMDGVSRGADHDNDAASHQRNGKPRLGRLCPVTGFKASRLTMGRL